jgi:PAS domain S-box-containing protein
MLAAVCALAGAYWREGGRLKRLSLLVAEVSGAPRSASLGPGALEEKLRGLLSGAGSQRSRLTEKIEELEVANKVVLYEKRRLNQLLDAMDDACLLLDLEGKVREFNKAAENCFAFRAGELRGCRLEEVLTDERLLAFFEENTARSTGAQIELSLTRQGDEEGAAWCRASLLPLGGEGGKGLGHLLQLRDITPLKMAERARGEFISHVSHELRSPLTTIKSYTDLLVEGGLSEAERLEFFNTIQAEAARLAKLIDNLLNISKIEMGSLALERGLVQVGRLVESICQAVEPQALAKGIRFEAHLPEKLPSSYLDKQMVEVALMNLLSNALKYTPQGGSVQVKVEDTPEEILIHVIDTGCGIPEADLPRVFDKFFRGAGEAVRAQTGSGLGLALSKKIVELHGGDIKVISREGTGSQFSVMLPKEEFRLMG